MKGAGRALSICFLVQCIVFLSGCNKIIDWGKSNFRQATRYSQNFISAAQHYIRSLIMYNEFTTIATFDAIFLTDHMRMLYVDYHNKCHGMTSEQEDSMRKRLINENKYYISFYVIGTQKEHIYNTNKALFTGEYLKQPEILGLKDCAWNVRMLVNGKEYMPESIRVIDLPIEFNNFFGHRISQFTTAYIVRFPINNSAGKPVIESHKKYNVVLRFTSRDYEDDMEWKNVVYSKNK